MSLHQISRSLLISRSSYQRLRRLPLRQKGTNTPSIEQPKPFDLGVHARQNLGISLTLSERKLIALAATGKTDGRVSRAEWERLVLKRTHGEQERLTLHDFIAKGADQHFGQHMLKWTGGAGQIFFAICGAHTAGEAGMHVVGATLVGAITAMGGGALNQMMMGSTPAGWMRNPGLVVAVVTASVASFYLWPLVELQMQEHEHHKVRPASADSETSSFDSAEPRMASPGSAARYALETLGLACFSVVGAQSGVIHGMHPVVSVCLGVTITLGGVFRDVMCAREIALASPSGAQSYALASFVGSATYVALRELHVWNCSGSTTKLVRGGIPIGARIFVSAGMAVYVRVLAWQEWKPDILFSSMERAASSNYAMLRTYDDTAFDSSPPEKK